MNAIFTTNNQRLVSWKTAALILAFLVTILVAAVGTESYLLLSAPQHAAWMNRQQIAPAKGQSPTVNTSVDISDDWPQPLTSGGNPWDQLNALHQRMDQMFNNALTQFPDDGVSMISALNSPNLDVQEEKDHYTIRADMPGADKSSIKVSVEGRLLTLSGERTSESEVHDDQKVVRSERSMARFVRTVQLPGPVKAGAVDAKYENGVLTLNLPKADQGSASTQVPIH